MVSKDPSTESFAGRVLVVIGFVILTFLLVTLLYFTFEVVLLTFAAALLAIFLRGLADIAGRFIKIGEGRHYGRP